ncbi:MAG: DNA repair protein RecO [Bacteroidota bacterium]
MIHRTEAIVFRTFPLRDSKHILKAFTKNFGLKSFVIRASRKSRSNEFAKTQALNLISIEWKEKNGDLAYANSIDISEPYKTIPINIEKSSIVLFLAEVLQKSIKEEIENPQLFAFLKNALLYLDTTDSYANFHLSFLIKLSKFHGYLPVLEGANGEKIFDMQNAVLLDHEPRHEYYFSEENSKLLKSLSGMNFDTCESLHLNRERRNLFLNDVLNYYRYHIEGMEEIKGHEVLQTVFE